MNAGFRQSLTNSRGTCRGVAASTGAYKSKFEELNPSIPMTEHGLSNKDWTIRVEFDCDRSNQENGASNITPIAAAAKSKVRWMCSDHDISSLPRRAAERLCGTMNGLPSSHIIDPHRSNAK
jgi:hypothetical protein